MFEAQNFDHLIGTTGFSEKLLTTHFTLYQGYVKNTNALIETLDDMMKEDKAGTPAFNELKRRMGWEFNGMRLHELYFGGMTKEPVAMDENSGLAKKLSAQFGSVENWKKDFTATGTIRGIGWVVLYLDPASGNLFNVWINEHDMGHFAGCTPLLIMDVFEHAFMLDYGTNRADYIAAYFNAIDWHKAAALYDSKA